MCGARRAIPNGRGATHLGDVARGEGLARRVEHLVELLCVLVGGCRATRGDKVVELRVERRVVDRRQVAPPPFDWVPAQTKAQRVDYNRRPPTSACRVQIPCAITMHVNITTTPPSGRSTLSMFVSLNVLGLASVLAPVALCWVAWCFGRAADRRRSNAVRARQQGRAYLADRTPVMVGATCLLAVACAFVGTVVAWYSYVSPLRAAYDESHRSGEFEMLRAAAVALISTIFGVWVLCGLASFLLLLHLDEGKTELIAAASRVDSSVLTLLADGKIRLVRCAWLRDTFASAAVGGGGGESVRMPRRQELPEATAFFPPGEARALYEDHKRGCVFVLS